MEKDELIEYLTENLSIDIRIGRGDSLKVKLLLDGEEISSSDVYLPERDKGRDF